VRFRRAGHGRRAGGVVGARGAVQLGGADRPPGGGAHAVEMLDAGVDDVAALVELRQRR
jgi:hypothetical protein